MVKVTTKYEEEENPIGLLGPVVGRGWSTKWTSFASSSLAVLDGKNSELSSEIWKAVDIAHEQKSVLRGESGCNF